MRWKGKEEKKEGYYEGKGRRIDGREKEKKSYLSA